MSVAAKFLCTLPGFYLMVSALTEMEEDKNPDVGDAATACGLEGIIQGNRRQVFYYKLRSCSNE